MWLFSYFGYSVTVADVDGNELDDVIIGAPFYHNETNYDQGAILVYLQFKKEEKGEDNQHYYVMSKVEFSALHSYVFLCSFFSLLISLIFLIQLTQRFTKLSIS